LHGGFAFGERRLNDDITRRPTAGSGEQEKIDMPSIKGIHVGEQFIQSDEHLLFCNQMGVEHVDASPLGQPGITRDGYVYADPSKKKGSVERDLREKGYWDTDTLIQFREHVESFGVSLAAMHMPLQALDVHEQIWPNIMRGTPERDRDIEKVCKCIEAAGKAGIPVLLYNLTYMRTVRNAGVKVGRGGITHTYFDYARLDKTGSHPDGSLSADQAWERIKYFIDRVIPVAEEYKVRMGCHPNDPAMPAGGFRGVETVLATVDGLKKFIDLHPSEYHGLNFCQGCVSQACTDAEQVYEAIRYFGTRKKIFFVHFRNIRGSYLKFEEAFPDEGSIDMAKAMRTYDEVGYDGLLVTDHVPHSSLDTELGHQAHAFSIGYIKGLIDMIASQKREKSAVRA